MLVFLILLILLVLLAITCLTFSIFWRICLLATEMLSQCCRVRFGNRLLFPVLVSRCFHIRLCTLCCHGTLQSFRICFLVCVLVSLSGHALRMSYLSTLHRAGIPTARVPM